MGFLLIATLAIIITVLTIETMRIIFLFRYFYKEVIFASGRSRNGSSATAEPNFIGRLVLKSAAAFYRSGTVVGSFYLNHGTLYIVKGWPSRILQRRKHLSSLTKIWPPYWAGHPNGIVSLLPRLQLRVLPNLRYRPGFSCPAGCCRCGCFLPFREVIVLVAGDNGGLAFGLLRRWRLYRDLIINKIVDRLNIAYGLYVALNI